jgi:hypothetical protein
MLIRQFFNIHHESLNYLIVRHSKGSSQYKDGPNLFGWGDRNYLRQYTNSFSLEIVYDKT